MSVPEQTLIILGASGDLTRRLLLPAIGQVLIADRERHLEIIAVEHEASSAEERRSVLTTAFQVAGAKGRRLTQLIRAVRFEVADVTRREDLERVLSSASGTPVLYFALPPQVTAKACEALEGVALPEGTTLALEKPFGSDARSAAALNRRLQRLVPEDRIHRVDHFLGFSSLLNIIGLRFANPLFEGVWNRDRIASVSITYDEPLGIEGRAGYYDRAGALVDMLQSHLLQVLAIVAMEPPASIDPDDLRDAIAAVLRATRVYGADPIAHSRRARYLGGTVDGRRFPAYVKEAGVDPERQTETLAEVTFEVATARWAGVPFMLRSGKAIGEARKQIVIEFKPMPHIPRGLEGSTHPNRLTIGLEPDTLLLELAMNGAGDPRELNSVPFSATLSGGDLVPYAEVVQRLLDGDPTLSIRGDVAERSWRIVAPVLRAWRNDRVPLDEYRTGSRGPAGWR